GCQVRSERARWVHRRPRDRAAPKSGERGVAPYSERTEDSDVLGAGCCPENHTDQTRGEEEFHPERGDVRVAMCRIVAAVARRDVDDGMEYQCGQGGPAKLR